MLRDYESEDKQLGGRQTERLIHASQEEDIDTSGEAPSVFGTFYHNQVDKDPNLEVEENRLPGSYYAEEHRSSVTMSGANTEGDHLNHFDDSANKQEIPVAGEEGDDLSFPLYVSFKANDPAANVSDVVREQTTSYNDDDELSFDDLQLNQSTPPPTPYASFEKSVFDDDLELDPFDMPLENPTVPIFKPLATPVTVDDDDVKKADVVSEEYQDAAETTIENEDDIVASGYDQSATDIYSDEDMIDSETIDSTEPAIGIFAQQQELPVDDISDYNDENPVQQQDSYTSDYTESTSESFDSNDDFTQETETDDSSAYDEQPTLTEEQIETDAVDSYDVDTNEEDAEDTDKEVLVTEQDEYASSLGYDNVPSYDAPSYHTSDIETVEDTVEDTIEDNIEEQPEEELDEIDAYAMSSENSAFVPVFATQIPDQSDNIASESSSDSEPETESPSNEIFDDTSIDEVTIDDLADTDPYAATDVHPEDLVLDEPIDTDGEINSNSLLGEVIEDNSDNSAVFTTPEEMDEEVLTDASQIDNVYEQSIDEIMKESIDEPNEVSADTFDPIVVDISDNSDSTLASDNEPSPAFESASDDAAPALENDDNDSFFSDARNFNAMFAKSQDESAYKDIYTEQNDVDPVDVPSYSNSTMNAHVSIDSVNKDAIHDVYLHPSLSIDEADEVDESDEASEANVEAYSEDISITDNSESITDVDSTNSEADDYETTKSVMQTPVSSDDIQQPHRGDWRSNIISNEPTVRHDENFDTGMNSEEEIDDNEIETEPIALGVLDAGEAPSQPLFFGDEQPTEAGVTEESASETVSDNTDSSFPSAMGAFASRPGSSSDRPSSRPGTAFMANPAEKEVKQEVTNNTETKPQNSFSHPMSRPGGSSHAPTESTTSKVVNSPRSTHRYSAAQQMGTITPVTQTSKHKNRHSAVSSPKEQSFKPILILLLAIFLIVGLLYAWEYFDLGSAFIKDKDTETSASTFVTRESTTDSVTEATTEPTTQATTEATTEPTTEATTEPTTEATTEATTEPTETTSTGSPAEIHTAFRTSITNATASGVNCSFDIKFENTGSNDASLYDSVDQMTIQFSTTATITEVTSSYFTFTPKEGSRNTFIATPISHDVIARGETIYVDIAAVGDSNVGSFRIESYFIEYYR